MGNNDNKESGEDIQEDGLVKKFTNNHLPSTFIQARIIDSRGEEIFKTNTFVGIDPSWNETIEMLYKAFDAEKGLSVEEITKNEAILYISVFDMIGTFEGDYGT